MNSNTNSQNLPRTFSKLAKMWDNKTGTRTSGQGVWTHGSPEISSNYPLQYIPCILSSLFENKTPSENMSNVLNCLDSTNTKIQDNQIWIYAMRNSDCLPKNVDEEKKLYIFVKRMLSSWCNRETYLYMEKNIHICVCFFIWYFTKPNFFYTDKVIRQTCRNGIQRVWTPMFLQKEPKSVHVPIVNRTTNGPAAISSTNDTLLPKQQIQQEKLRKEIQELVILGTTKELDWINSTLVHIQVSECLTSLESKLSIKQTKKLQKIYNEYITITKKINRTLTKIRSVEMANSKKTPISSVPYSNSTACALELGPPPLLIPKLIRSNFSDSSEIVDNNKQISDCPGCANNQPNQQAHMGGCLPDDVESISDDEGVPDCWEDL